jgi:hypothetical protein
MKNIRFQVLTDDSGRTGEVGIMPCIFMNKGWNSYLPTTSPGHDLIDHSTCGDEKGEVYQELRALGANLFVHDFGSDMQTMYTESQHFTIRKGEVFAYEMDSILSDSVEFEGSSNLPDAPHAKLSKGEKDSFKMFWHGFCTAFEKAKAESEGDDDWYGDIQSYTYEFFIENKDKILGWFKHGYALAKRRFKGEFYYASDMKERINRTVRSVMRTLEEYADTGEVFTLSYDLENQHAEIKHRHLF